MDPTRIALFDLADKRLAWTAHRQAVLAQNLANVDTPGWQAQDVAPFEAATSQTPFALAVTQAGHLAGTVSTEDAAQQSGGERAPDGNAVSLDGQLIKIAETDVANNVATDVYKAYTGMFRTALGR